MMRWRHSFQESTQCHVLQSDLYDASQLIPTKHRPANRLSSFNSMKSLGIDDEQCAAPTVCNAAIEIRNEILAGRWTPLSIRRI